MFSPEWHDPALDVPFHCRWCKASGTREDVVEVTDSNTGLTGLLCSWCMEPNWDEEDE